MCARAYYDSGWGGVVFKTIGPKDFPIDEVSPRFDQLQMEDKPFIGFKNMEQIAEHPLEQNLDDLAKLKKIIRTRFSSPPLWVRPQNIGQIWPKMVTEAGADMIEMNLSLSADDIPCHGFRCRLQSRTLREVLPGGEKGLKTASSGQDDTKYNGHGSRGQKPAWPEAPMG